MIKLCLCGDIMIGRSFNATFKNYPHFNIWGNATNILKKADFVIANLETTITDHKKIYQKYSILD